MTRLYFAYRNLFEVCWLPLLQTPNADGDRNLSAVRSGSPLLANTEEQAAALHKAIEGGESTRVFIAMRYWHHLRRKLFPT